MKLSYNTFCFWLILNQKTESQIPTQRYGRRPFGVGLLVAGYDVSCLVFILVVKFVICFLWLECVSGISRAIICVCDIFLAIICVCDISMAVCIFVIFLWLSYIFFIFLWPSCVFVIFLWP